MLWKILLVALPALAHARISVNIVASTKDEYASVEYLGSSIEIIPDGERSSWRLQDGQLKDAARAYSGGRPNDAYVRSPTPWGDLYSRYGWDQVQRTLYPISAKILGIRAQPVIVTTQDFINNSSVTATYNAGVSQSVQESASSTWSTSNKIQVGQKITYKIGFEGVGEVGGETSFSYERSWGESKTETKTISVGSTSGVSVTLKPGESVVATLSATRGTMDVEVKYRATLSGYAAVNYNPTYKGHHFWAYDINQCLAAAGSPRTIESSEVIQIGFYANAEVKVSDKQSNAVLFTAPVEIF